MSCTFRIRRLVFPLGLLAVVPVLGWSQIALVRVTSCGPQAFPASCTIPSTGRGNLLVVGFQMQGNTSTTISNINDNAGNVYAEAGAARSTDTANSTIADLWYAKNSLAGATSLTITPSLSTSNGMAVVWEFSGVDSTAPFDQAAVMNNQASTASVSGASVTLTPMNEAIVSIAVVAESVGIASGNAFVNDSSLEENGWAHLITSSPGTYSAQWIQIPSGTYASSTASFKAASSTPNFTLSVTPASESVTQGTNGVYTLSVAPSGGFAGTVSLSATGLPTSATATFNPSSITTSGSSTLTVTTPSSTASGDYSLSITGTSGSLTHTATAALVVTSTTNSACDVNKDGVVNVVDAQVAANNAVSCTATTFQTFYSQVIGGIVSSCPVTSGLHTVSLNWAASTTSGVTYNVYRATSSGGYNYSSPLATGISGTSYSDCSVALGQAYYYVVRAVDGSGNQSANSAETTATIPSS